LNISIKQLQIMLALSSSVLGYSAGVAPVASMQRAAVSMETKADLEALAVELNPVVKFWDPLGLADATGGVGKSAEANIGWLRHAEIKHGRVAMFAFVGYCVQANGICWPWGLSLDGTSFADISAAGSPPAQWDALPTNSKWQIFAFIAGLELWSECAGTHYMAGGQPGKFPSFKPIKDEIGHPNLDLFDPFGFSKNASPEKKAKGLKAEINNGRLAQIGIMSLVSEAKVPGSVPGLAGKIAPYDGEIMAPWGPGDVSVPLVKEMLTWVGPWGSI